MQEAILFAAAAIAGALAAWFFINLRIVRRDWAWYFKPRPFPGSIFKDPAYIEDCTQAIFRGSRRSYKVTLFTNRTMRYWSSTEYVRPEIGKITRKEWHQFVGWRGRLVELEDFVGCFWISDFLERRQGEPPLPFRPPTIEGVQQ